MKSIIHLTLICCCALILAACSKTPADSAPAAVEAYLQGLVNNDATAISARSCTAWEGQAKMELSSFAAVKARLEAPNCQVSGTEGDYTLVSCSGKIVANYNGEDQDLKLGDRVFQAVQEGGQWRMCGYR